jgi:hypothetical protein
VFGYLCICKSEKEREEGREREEKREKGEKGEREKPIPTSPCGPAFKSLVKKDEFLSNKKMESGHVFRLIFVALKRFFLESDNRKLLIKINRYKSTHSPSMFISSNVLEELFQ